MPRGRLHIVGWVFHVAPTLSVFDDIIDYCYIDVTMDPVDSISLILRREVHKAAAAVERGYTRRLATHMTIV